MSIKVLMLPSLSHFRSGENGIKRVVIAYHKYLPEFGVEITDNPDSSYDLVAAHAGETNGQCDIAHTHGLYWTGDYQATNEEYLTNARVINNIRGAKAITVPSAWVADTFKRDMRLLPYVIPHGIEWQDWQHNQENQGYVLWNKNRANIDVCNTEALDWLIEHNPSINFVSTFGRKDVNSIIFNKTLSHQEMRNVIQMAGVYLSTTKETFGIGTLEAMASGVPVLGWHNGGNVDLVEHGANGYLATPGDYRDLQEGLHYCLRYRDILGANGRELAQLWTWQGACEKLARVYEHALVEQEASVSVVIPVYNKTREQLYRAIKSCVDQALQPKEIIVVNDGSDNTNDITEVIEHIGYAYNFEGRLSIITQDNQGVAIARNVGISKTTSKYICCLDADDWLEPTFLETCVKALESDRMLSLAYTKIKTHTSKGAEVPAWPGSWNFDRQLQKSNQVPTCCVFTREMWQRLGGYRQRYAPKGAGAEDAEFWLRAGAYGFKAALVSHEPLFNYSGEGGIVSESIRNKTFSEVDWLAWHPWTKDDQHPFASYATPKRHSHNVRQYDEPKISVIIPVGPGHETEVVNALDSLEAQTFRNWEALVIWDFDITGNRMVEGIQIAYPYAKFRTYGDNRGAGAARNLGVICSKASLIFYLDADDTLHPSALSEVFYNWNKYGEIIYTDFVGKGIPDESYLAGLKLDDRLLEYDQNTGKAIWEYHYIDFDPDKAQKQPKDSYYDWSTISILLPKTWHDAIGGFDESMPTWEDWDYKLRLVRAGYCFRRVSQKLLAYNTSTGMRRLPAKDGDRQSVKVVLEYMRKKFEDIPTVGCNCKEEIVAQVAAQDGDFLRAKWLGPQGNRHVTGPTEFPSKMEGINMRKKSANKWAIYYGHITHGDIRPVHKSDYERMPGKWELLAQQPVSEREVEAPRQELKEPELIEMPLTENRLVMKKSVEVTSGDNISDELKEVQLFDLQSIPGVTVLVSKNLTEAGLTTLTAIRNASDSELLAIDGIGKSRLKIIRDYVRRN